MIKKGLYLWFIYFIVIFLLTICILVKTNYYELINVRLYDERLI